MTDFPYPGDDPASLAAAASTFDTNVTNMTTLITAVNEAEANIKGNWTGDTANAASGDVAKINKVLSITIDDFRSSKTALDTLHDALVPIRTRVDELRAELTKAQDVLDGERFAYGRADRFGEANDMTPAQITEYRSSIAAAEKKTQDQISTLYTEYQAQVTKANSATDTCSTALKATISGSTYDPGQGGITSTNLDDMLGLGNLALLHRWQAGQDAKTAAADATRLLTLDPHSAEAEKLAKQLQALLDKYPDGDPDFSVPFLKQVTPDGLLHLEAYCAGLSGNDTSDGGQAMMAVDGDIQRTLGTDLAAATHLLGKPNPDGTQQLGQSYVDELLKDGGKSYNITIGVNTVPVKGFQSLGMLLRTGDYGSSMLDQSGRAFMNYEKAYASANGGTDSLSSNAWYQDGAQPGTRLWYGSGNGSDAPLGLDPFDGWVSGMDNSSQAKQALFDDVTGHSNKDSLTDYLLNDRDWSMRDVDNPPSIMGHYQDGESSQSLIDLGKMLDTTVQGTSKDPQSQAIYESMIKDLGDDQLNPRIGSGHFGGTDWIQPELRPFLGDIVAKNIDLTHNTLAGQAGSGGIDQTDMKRVLMDLGKDHGDGGGAAAVIKSAESSYVKDLIATKIHNGDMSYQSDGAGMAKVFAGLDFGSQTSASQAQVDADTAHNAMVDEVVGDFSSVVGFGVDSATDEIPGAGLVTGWLIDHTADDIKDALHHDGLGLVQAHNDDASDVSRQTFDSTLRQAALLGSRPPAGSPDAASFDAMLQNSGLIGPDGKLRPIDDAALGEPGWTAASKWLADHGHSGLLNLTTDSETTYSASYSDDASHYLGTP